MNRSAVKQAPNLNLVAELRHHVLAGGSFFGELNVIVFEPANETPRARAARLHAGAASENDHDVLAKGFLVFLDAVAEAFTGSHHDGDGNDAPGDAEHR